jgi:hypothetical protein
MYEIMKIQMHFQSNYEKKNGQSWVLLYGTKDDVG